MYINKNIAMYIQTINNPSPILGSKQSHFGQDITEEAPVLPVPAGSRFHRLPCLQCHFLASDASGSGEAGRGQPMT